jgi:LemA protein
MGTAGIIGWIVVVAVAVAGIAIFNRLVRLRNAIANAFAQIDVQLKRRYDLIPNLVESRAQVPAA